MNLKKRYWIFFGLLILFISIFTIVAIDYESSWHSLDEILVTVDGYTMTLEEAMDNNVFIDGATQSYTTEIPNPGHNANEIWVSVDGNEMTLQEAILTTDGLCGSSSITSYSSSPTSLTYQFANEIEILLDTSLQDAINNRDLVSIDGGWSEWSDWSTCSVECGGGTQTRTRTCTNPIPYCGGADCVGGNSETQNCNTQACPTTWTWQPFTYVSCYPSTCSGICNWSIVGESCSPQGNTYVCEGGSVNCHGYMGCGLYQSLCD